ncbi:MAG: AIM24 family protein [Chloroflexota bacterium]|nr:AIM24 family protein [Chloroflexota bacterium]
MVDHPATLCARQGALPNRRKVYLNPPDFGVLTKGYTLQGRVYLADKGKKIRILNLQDDTIFVNGNDVLALEDTIVWDITMMRRVAGMLAGGLFNIRLSGTGMIAITTHYAPLTLRVTPDEPVFTDPNATVAWSGSLTPEGTTDISMRTLLGRGSGESIQLKFEGSGWVVLQPYEESQPVQGS